MSFQNKIKIFNSFALKVKVSMSYFFMYVFLRLPVKTLQLEQMAVVGRAEEPSVVASRMRLVFSTLEVS